VVLVEKELEVFQYEQWAKAILRALEGLEYGTLQITVHDSQITQMERIERQRFPLQTLEARKQANRR
jgi:hypothetical protein